MPTGSNNRPVDLQPIPVSRRYLRRNAQRAMAGSIVRALIELLTNARDSAHRLLGGLRLAPEDIERRPIEVEYLTRGRARAILVRDHFEGMSRQVMKDKLLRYGETASGFEEGNYVRGINARGAKDVGALGEVRFESICDDRYAECLITEGQYSEPIERRATQTDRERLQLLAGNGTVVTLTPFEGVTVPNFESLARDIEHHIEMRYRPEGVPTVNIKMSEVRERGGRERELIGFEPEGQLILDQEINLPEFAGYGASARLRLYRSTEPLQPCLSRGGLARMWRSEAGVIVGDGHTAHDITFFHARGSDEPVSHHLYGELSAPQIARLLREYERFEADREVDSSVRAPELNPEQVTDPDRLGLNAEHPFVQALQEEVRPILERVLAEIQRELTPPAPDRVSAELRSALDRLGEQLAERLEVGSGDPTRDRPLPQGLTIMPPGLRLELGRSKRMGLYYRVEGTPGEELPPCSISASSEAVHLPATSIQLEPVLDRAGLFRGSFEVAGRQLTDLVLIKATLQDYTATARISVREPGGGIIVLDRDLQFSQRRYTSVPNRHKRVELFADPALAEMDVEVRATGERLALSTSVVHLEFDAERGIASGTLHVESAEPLSDTLLARCGELSDEADVVFEDVNSRPKLEFILDDVDSFGMPGRRFLWESPTSNKLHIAASHRTLSRVFGPAVENWPGQNDPQARAILAELVADAYVYRRIQADLPSLGTGPENAVDPVEYESYRYRYFEEVFMLCHGLLTPAYSAS
jgi:hypothetical protein